jgi:hypothetical protein
MKGFNLGPRRQGIPAFGWHLSHRIGIAIDAGRKIDPVLRPTAEALHR